MANSLSSILFLAKQRSTFNKSNMIDYYSTKFGFSFLFDHFIRIILIIINPIQQWIYLSIEKYRKLFTNELRKHSLRLIISAIVVIIQLLWFTSYYFDHHDQNFHHQQQLQSSIIIPNKSIDDSMFSKQIWFDYSSFLNDNYQPNDWINKSNEWLQSIFNRLIFLMKISTIMIIMEILRLTDTVWTIICKQSKNSSKNKNFKHNNNRYRSKSFIDLTYIERNRGYK
ncbi:hypothetical protein DERP_011673 [Dermatophagoides pteronyssinus]|uniref:Uncharacterized protein n=1 Tax=Dermatophagoides pteronyssinus TaxID=6956 RepID=A0ABQ8J2Y8_DERPT|nr:hypothetical protein DERP_011673 [Dermatophagoides pteronyssinus]